MGTIVTFSQERGLERTHVPTAEEPYWLAFWSRGGVPAARLADYRAWGGFFATVSDRRVMLRREWGDMTQPEVKTV